MKLPHRATRRPGVHLSDLEHVVLLATSPRRLGRTGHVELLLLLGDVGQIGPRRLFSTIAAGFTFFCNNIPW